MLGSEGHDANCGCPCFPCLRGLDTSPECWTTRVRGVGNGYWRAIGSAEQLIALAQRIGQRWLKGLRLAG